MYPPSDMPCTPTRSPPWPRIHENSRRTSQIACEAACTSSRMSTDGNPANRLSRRVRRTPCSGRIGNATLSPRLWWRRAARNAGRSMGGRPMPKPWTQTTHGRVRSRVAEHRGAGDAVLAVAQPARPTGLDGVGLVPRLPADPLEGRHAAGDAAGSDVGERRRRVVERLGLVEPALVLEAGDRCLHLDVDALDLLGDGCFRKRRIALIVVRSIIAPILHRRCQTARGSQSEVGAVGCWSSPDASAPNESISQFPVRSAAPIGGGDGTMRRLSGQDAAFLYGETPNWHMHISGADGHRPCRRRPRLLVRALPRGAHRATPRGAAAAMEAGRRPVRHRSARWVEDPDLDPDYHIRRIGLPAPGGERELNEVVGRIAGYKLNRDKPLWEAWVIEGLEGGKVATVDEDAPCPRRWRVGRGAQRGDARPRAHAPCPFG